MCNQDTSLNSCDLLFFKLLEYAEVTNELSKQNGYSSNLVLSASSLAPLILGDTPENGAQALSSGWAGGINHISQTKSPSPPPT